MNELCFYLYLLLLLVRFGTVNIFLPAQKNADVSINDQTSLV